MSVQKSLKSFFKPMQTKRVSTDSVELDLNAKKPKLETCDETVGVKVPETAKPEETKPGSPPGSEKDVPETHCVEEAHVTDAGKAESNENSAKHIEEQVKQNDGTLDELTYSQCSTQEVRDASFTGKIVEDGPTYSQRSTQEVRDDNIDKKKPDDESTKSPDGAEVLKDVTKEDNNKSNFTTPVKKETNLIPTPLGMLSPLQCMARIKSQCSKTPALHHSIGSSWFFALQGEFTKPYFNKLSQFMVAERKKSVIYPPEHQVWTWTNLCTIKEVKVVILGQDPYHNPGQAHGLCFSVQKGIPPPPSLVNMYKELENDIPGFKAPGHGNLTGWAQQGVLLLNACLTVRANCANSHKDQGWEQLTDAVIKRLSDTGNGIVFLLWGSYAHKKGGMVNKKKHHVLQTTHPSPLSAHRGFLGCKHFSKCNALLKQGGRKPIDWSHLPLV